MYQNFFSSSNQPKPQRRMGRRSMAFTNNTNTNVTLNGTLNNTTKHPSEFSLKMPYEPSCASTPLPDHKNKENIFLSSIKPTLASSPKSARKVPYQRRLGRNSMAPRNQDLQSEAASLNDSLSRMKHINSTLKLSDPKPKTEEPASQPSSFQSSVNSFLNYDFLKKYLPTTASPKLPTIKVQEPSPAKSEHKYESVLKPSKCEMIVEASESPTIELVPLPDSDDFLKKSLTCVSKLSDSPVVESSKYGSFLGDVSPRKEEKKDVRSETPVKLGAEDAIPDSKTSDTKSCLDTKDKSEEDLNRTFEIEEDNMIFKTPCAMKFHKRDQSAIFKTPMSSIFNRFQNIDDNNDSFVENERTIMLQFKNEPKVTTEKCVTPPQIVTTTTSSVHTATLINTSVPASASSVVNTSNIPVSNLQDSLQDFINQQRNQFELFLREQAERQSKERNKFLDSQNSDLVRFITNMARTEQSLQVPRDDTLLQSQSNPTITVSESETTTTGTDLHTTLFDDTTVDPTISTAAIPVDSKPLEETVIDHASVQTVCSDFSESVVEESTETFYNTRSKPRQSIAFSNFKRNCSILKTPSRSRRSVANNTAVFTPGSLSVCIRDQLEALEDD